MLATLQVSSQPTINQHTTRNLISELRILFKNKGKLTRKGFSKSPAFCSLRSHSLTHHSWFFMSSIIPGPVRYHGQRESNDWGERQTYHSTTRSSTVRSANLSAYDRMTFPFYFLAPSTRPTIFSVCPVPASPVACSDSHLAYLRIVSTLDFIFLIFQVGDRGLILIVLLLSFCNGII